MALIEYQRLKGAGASAAITATNLPVVNPGDADGEVAELFSYFREHFGREEIPGILRCFATHPPLLRSMMALADEFLFVEGELSRRQKEMIAALVSTRNACAYCADSHSYFLRIHGGSAEALAAIEQDDLQSSALTLAEQSLLAFVRKVNAESHAISKADVEQVVQAGWTQPQVAEAVHVAALFATFNRVANAFGLSSQGLLSLFEEDKIRAAE